MSEIARIAFDILAHAWPRRDTLLVDMKIEFGRLTGGSDHGQLAIADVIDNDSWRIWPQGREELMLDKQMYRNLAEVKPEDLDPVQAAYQQVAEIVGGFPTMRPGMLALMAGGPEHLPQTDAIARALGQFGLQTVRRIASPSRTAQYVLQLVQQLDATHSRLLFVAVEGEGSALADLLDNATATPVLRAANASPETLGMVAAKTFAVDDTVMFGRVLLVQANGRSQVLAADAQLTTPPPPPDGQLA